MGVITYKARQSGLFESRVNYFGQLE